MPPIADSQYVTEVCSNCGAQNLRTVFALHFEKYTLVPATNFANTEPLGGSDERFYKRNTLRARNILWP